MKTRVWKIEVGDWLAHRATAAAARQSAAFFPQVSYRHLAKRRHVLWALLLATTIARPSGHAQSYSVDWYKIAGGGGMSTGGTYQVSGTIGQPDASGAMSSGQYSVTGGFWSLINVVQMPGVPKLLIVPNGPNSVKVLWPDPATNTYTLQQNANVAAPGGWTTSDFSISTSNGTNSITITPPTGNLFFRLSNP